MIIAALLVCIFGSFFTRHGLCAISENANSKKVVDHSQLQQPNSRCDAGSTPCFHSPSLLQTSQDFLWTPPFVPTESAPAAMMLQRPGSTVPLMLVQAQEAVGAFNTAQASETKTRELERNQQDEATRAWQQEQKERDEALLNVTRASEAKLRELERKQEEGERVGKLRLAEIEDKLAAAEEQNANVVRQEAELLEFERRQQIEVEKKLAVAEEADRNATVVMQQAQALKTTAERAINEAGQAMNEAALVTAQAAETERKVNLLLNESRSVMLQAGNAVAEGGQMAQSLYETELKLLGSANVVAGLDAWTNSAESGRPGTGGQIGSFGDNAELLPNNFQEAEQQVDIARGGTAGDELAP